MCVKRERRITLSFFRLLILLPSSSEQEIEIFQVTKIRKQWPKFKSNCLHRNSIIFPLVLNRYNFEYFLCHLIIILSIRVCHITCLVHFAPWTDPRYENKSCADFPLVSLLLPQTTYYFQLTPPSFNNFYKYSYPDRKLRLKFPQINEFYVFQKCRLIILRL